MASTDPTSLRQRQFGRLIRRMREAPPSFLAWKAWERVSRVWWTGVYRCGAGRARRTELAFRFRKVVGDSSPFGRRYDTLSDAPWEAGHRDWVLRTADEAKSGHMTILGHGVQDFGRPIKWSLDPVRGVEWPAVAGLRVPLVRGDLYGDIKVPWELNRLQFLCTVAQAWAITSRECYRSLWIEILEEWDGQNAQGMGVAWSCAMEVAIRAANLVASGAMMWPALELSDRKRLIAILDEHLMFLRRHPERSDVSGNHYLVDVGVTLQLELLLGQGKRTRRVRKSAAVFFREVRAQFTDGGLHFEFTTNYHRFMTELVLLTFAECDRWELAVPQDLRALISRAVRNCSVVAGPGRTTLPLIGDADSGQVLRLDGRSPNDIRYVRALGAYVLGDLQPGVEDSPAAAWAVGSATGTPRSLGAAVEIPYAETIDGLGVASTACTHVVVRAGAPGLGGRGGHDHSDLTSPVITMADRPIVVDPGTQQYTYSRRAREDELSALAHNMVIIDGQDPAPLMEGSVMPTVSTTTRGHVTAELSEQAVVLRCGHNGFAANSRIELYERRIESLTREPHVLVIDQFEGRGSHRIQAQWHFHPSLTVERIGASQVALLDRTTGQTVAAVELVAGYCSVTIEQYDWSPEYGTGVPAMKLRLDGEFQLPCKLTTLFTAYLGEESG